MYVGRIVVVGRSYGRNWIAYRVSSRSFPDRRAEARGKSILVSPLNANDLARNPYIAYNCIHVGQDFAVAANGMQSDMILEKIEDGMKPLDAIALSLVAYGYERDQLDTPRIAGAVREDKAWLGIAKKDEFRTKEFCLRDNNAFMIATYEKIEFVPISLSGQSPSEVAREAFELSFERPVCSAAAFALPGGRDFDLAVYNPK